MSENPYKHAPGEVWREDNAMIYRAEQYGTELTACLNTFFGNLDYATDYMVPHGIDPDNKEQVADLARLFVGLKERYFRSLSPRSIQIQKITAKAVAKLAKRFSNDLDG